MRSYLQYQEIYPLMGYYIANFTSTSVANVVVIPHALSYCIRTNIGRSICI